MDDIKRKIGEILVENGVLGRDQLDGALAIQAKEGGLVGQILIRTGCITEEELTAAISRQLRIPYLPLSQYSLNQEASLRLNEDFCRRHQLLAFDDDDGHIFVAGVCPVDGDVLEAIEKKAGRRVRLFNALPGEILAMTDIVFQNKRRPELKKTA